MANKWRALAARRVTKAIGCPVLLVTQDHALQPTGHRRQLGGCMGLLGGESLSTGDANGPAADDTPQTFAGPLANLARLMQTDFLSACGVENRFG